jgi:hypothetical protein
MRVPWAIIGSLAVLLALCLPATTGALGEDGIDPRVPRDVYKEEDFHPFVEFFNVTLPVNSSGIISVNVSYKGTLPGPDTELNARFIFDIYGRGEYGHEEDLSGTLPKFRFFDEGQNMTVESLVFSTNVTVPKDPVRLEITPTVAIPETTQTGYYRVRVTMEWSEGTARSMGGFTPEQWRENLDRVRNGDTPIGAFYLISEAGFTVVPKHYRYVSLPNKVPDFGDFTTPVIRPGEKGTYNFTVTNRYDLDMTDVEVIVEFYMWATIEDAKPIEDIDGPPPKVEGEGVPGKLFELGTLEPGEPEAVKVTIVTSDDTDKGTYFVRHYISFEYEGTRFAMASRGHYTWEQWEGFDYSNLYYQLEGSAGIVPDSSFSVKDPVPLWPLATLIAFCVLFGALAVVFYLAEEHGDQYPRLKKGVQFWSGKYQQRKRLMQQRMDELRGEDWDEEPEGKEDT